MVHTTNSRTQTLREAANAQARHRLRTSAVLAAVVGGAALHMAQYLIKTPMYTSALTGEQWTKELLDGHWERFHNMMGMNKRVFRKLNQELEKYSGFKGSRCGTPRSAVFDNLLNRLTDPQFYTRYMKLPPSDITPPEIRTNPKLFPFLKDCLGALDGTHIDAFIPDESQIARNRNRKGGLTQNVLAATTFDMRFAYVRAGWEGCAADSRVFADARATDFAIPPGKYYLGDAGFPACDALLVPYRGVRYHLKEWSRSTNTPRDYKELFNLRHAQARNVVERIFGVVKRRFRLINTAPEYSLKKQAKMVLALCVLHNFIRVHDPQDLDGATLEDLNNYRQQSHTPTTDDYSTHISHEERDRANDFRDRIAKQMWEQYQQYLQQNM
ncbi:hypothetical protein CCMSSC00406_0007287 [Pleurotus cornucopiae]|uniref:Uncharacterized protein n=1 Tax=Pleurotus cornucopiae TaxID=5321 RepID=A0ACB7IJF9_PLECO|nr:hypothetical protein CCMSSC00406_0007287 [Pleurotus cornucopiae]